VSSVEVEGEHEGRQQALHVELGRLMARPGTKASRKPDKKRANEWPVDKYPYVIIKPYADPSYQGSFKTAISHLKDDIAKLKDRLKDYDKDVVKCCDRILEKIEKLSADGGSVDEMAVPYHNVRYRAQLVRREQI
jgi:hypothetical protein